MELSTSVWVFVLIVLIALVFWVLKGAPTFGDEDDLWSARALCDRLADELDVDAEALYSMWAHPEKYLPLCQRAREVVREASREWRLKAGTQEIEATLLVTWANGKQSALRGRPDWSDLPQEVRAHFISHQEPLKRPFKLPFYTPTSHAPASQS